MKPFLWILGAAAILFFLPRLLTLFRRIRMAVRLRAAAKKNVYTLRPLHPLWFFGTNSGTSPDVLFEKTENGERRIYSVKLWASGRKMQNIVFIGTDPQTVQVRRIIPLAGRFGTWMDWDFNPITDGTGGGINWLRETRPKKREPVDYWTPAGTSYGVIPVLLFCPAPMNVAEARVVRLSHTTVERQPMYTKAPETTLEKRRLFDGDLLHEREYVFGTRAFITELTYPTVGRSV